MSDFKPVPVPEETYLKVGDIVYTEAGDRMANRKERQGMPLKIIELGRFHSCFPAALCEKPDGKRSLFLTKNLIKKDKDGNIIDRHTVEEIDETK